MCGFIGIVRKNSSALRRADDSFRGLLNKRGPDDFKIFHSPCGRVDFYFYRLSIIDLEMSSQPVSSATGKTTAVFNGEIYNYLELRQHLESKGVKFKSTGDSEVIPNLYELYGENFVQKLRGMFTIMLYDGDKVVIYRDRLGIKPLYYHETESEIIFASEVKPLLKLMNDKKKEISKESLEDYLNYGYVLSPHNIFKNIKTVAPAEKLAIKNGKIHTEQYWKISNIRPNFLKQEDAIKIVEQKIDEVVKLHLQADVPVGIFLSGGFDSGIIAARASTMTSSLKAYTLRFVDKKIDESKIAADIAKKYHLTHEIYDVTSDDLLNELAASIWQSEAPLADSGMMANLFISRKVRAEGIKVALCGAGGDEIFAGYTYHVRDTLEKKITRLRRLVHAGSSLFPGELSGKLKRAASFDLDPVFHYIGKTRVFNNFDRYKWDEDLKVKYFKEFQHDPSTARLTADLQSYVPDNLMLLIDRATMAYSVEGRVPFLDHEIVELMISLPSEVRTLNGDRKGMLKEIGKKILPSSMYSLPKMGFNSPVNEWMNGKLGELVSFALSPQRIKNREYFEILEERKINLAALNFHQKWTLLQLELFYRMFLDKNSFDKVPSIEELF